MTPRPPLVLLLLPALAAVACGTRRTASDPTPAPAFTDAAAGAGLNFRHFPGATGRFYLHEVMAPGAAVLDYDGDGDLDVYLIQGNVLEPGKKPEDSLFPPPKQHWPGNRLFRNEIIPSGKLRFTDVTETAGVGHVGFGNGAIAGDYDNDGDPDLYVTNFGPNVLYRNNGDGTFTDVTRQAGVEDDSFSASAAFVDYDKDADLDLYVTHYNTFTERNNKLCRARTGERDYCSPTAYFPLPDRLFRNEGRGRFRDVTRQAGLLKAYGHGLGVTCADFDGDGRIDIYVANDMTPNQLWRNRGDGTFEDVALLTGTAYDGNGQLESGMGVTAEDFDGDGDFDIFKTNLRQQTNTLYLNDGAGNFEDATDLFGLGASSRPFTGFGTRWLDYDNDGLLDLFVANGAVMLLEELRGDPFPYHQKNVLFRFDGKRYHDVSAASGPVFELSEVSRAAAFGDIDNDGDIDIVVSNCNGPTRLMLNHAGSRNHWLQVRLEGVSVNRDAMGALVALHRRGRVPVLRRVSTDGSYLSSCDLRVHFGLGGDDQLHGAPPEALVVHWPNGGKEIFTNLRPDRLVVLKEGTGAAGS